MHPREGQSFYNNDQAPHEMLLRTIAAATSENPASNRLVRCVRSGSPARFLPAIMISPGKPCIIGRITYLLRGGDPWLYVVFR